MLTVRELLTLLGDDDVAERERAKALLQTISPDVLTEKLASTITHGTSWHARANAAAMLGQMPSERAIGCLAVALAEERTDYCKRAAIAALAQIWMAMEDPFDHAFDTAIAALGPARLDHLRRAFRRVDVMDFPAAFGEAVRTFIYATVPAHAGNIPDRASRHRQRQHVRDEIICGEAYTFTGIAWSVDKHGTIVILPDSKSVGV